MKAELQKEKKDEYSSHTILKARLAYIPKINEKFNDNMLSKKILPDLQRYEKLLSRYYTDHLKTYTDFLNSIKNNFLIFFFH